MKRFCCIAFLFHKDKSRLDCLQAIAAFFRAESLPTTLIALLVLAIGHATLSHKVEPLGTHQHESRLVFVPSALYASGYGFVNVETPFLPELEAFLNGDRETFAMEPPSQDIRAIPYEPFQALHRSLIILTGFVWRVFGISWTSMKWLLAFILALSAVIAYHIFRLGMNRYISFACTLLFVLSPAILLSMHSLRSISKMPFILAIILILGQLSKQPVSGTGYWIRAAVAGMLIGIGAGFRQDVIVCLLPCVVIFPFCARGKTPLTLPVRTGAALLLLSSFLVCFAPVLKANREYGTPFHDVIMGFSELCNEEVGLQPGSYEKSYAARDNFIVANVNSYAQRAQAPDISLRDRTGAYNSAAFHYVMENAFLFPADFIIRSYAAVLRGLTRYDLPRPALLGWTWGKDAYAPVYRDTHLWGLVASIIALALLFSHSYYHGIMTSFLVVYFLGYTSILFYHLHVYHLAFIPLWFSGYCINRAIMLFRKRERNIIIDCLQAPRAWLMPAMGRLLTVGFIVASLVWIPLYAARGWQNHQLRRVRSLYETATLTSLQWESRPIEDFVLLKPTAPLDSRRYAYHSIGYPDAWPTPGDYLAVTLKSSRAPRSFCIRYENLGFDDDYSWYARLLPEEHANNGVSTFFFPVYERPSEAGGLDCGSFAGLIFNAAAADAFLGLYRVENASAFRLWPAFTLPGDIRDFKGYQSLSWRLSPETDARDFLPDVLIRQMRVNTMLAKDCSDEMIHEAEALLGQAPFNAALHIALGEAYQKRGDVVSCANVYVKALGLFPEITSLYRRLDELWSASDDDQRRRSEWAVLARNYPVNADVHYWMGKAWQDAREFEKARTEFEHAVSLDAGVAAFHRALGDVMFAQGHHNDALTAYLQAATLTPTDMGIIRAQARTYHSIGDTETAFNNYLACVLHHPDSEELAEEFDTFLLDTGNLQRRASCWQEMLQAHEDSGILRMRLGIALEEAGDSERALVEYRHAYTVIPDNFSLMLRLGSAWIASGDTTQGSNMLDLAQGRMPHRMRETAQAHARAAQHLYDNNRPAEAIALYQKAIDMEPHFEWPRLRLAEIYEAQEMFDEAIEEYRAILLNALEFSHAAQKLSDLLTRVRPQEESISTWRDITLANPDEAIPHVFLGIALEASGHQTEALDVYRKAYACDPENTLVLLHLGNALLQTDNRASGETMLELALLLNSDYSGEVAEAYAGHAKQSLAEEHYEDAAALYRKAIELAPSVLWHRVHLAETLEAQMRFDEALEQYTCVLMQAPESPVSAAQLDSLFVRLNMMDKRVAAWRAIVEAHPNAVVPRKYLNLAIGKEEPRP